MGWFSDALFGKRKKIDQNKVNSYMDPYNKMLNEQEDIARQMMDPNSQLNRGRQDMLRQNSYDMLGEQNQNLMQNAYMTNVSPAQMMAQQTQMANQQQGQFGGQMQGLLQGQFDQGNANLGNVMSMRKGEGERLSNAHIQTVNAHNARRQANMDLTVGLVGTALGAAGSFMPGPKGQ